MELSRHQILQITQALVSLSAEKEGRSVFKFPARATWALVRNARVFSRLSEDIEQVRACLIRDISPEAQRIEPGTPEHAEFSAKWLEFLLGTCDVEGVTVIGQDDLNLDDNQIPLAVLVALTPLVIDAGVTQ